MKSLDFLLWNTKLAPPSSAPPQAEEHSELVHRVVSDVCETGCGLMALTEVRRLNLVQWIPENQRANWACIQDSSGARYDFDVALMYDRGLMSLILHEFIVASYASSRVRCGLLSVFELTDGAPIIVIAAHWRSDLGGHDAASARRLASASAIRSAISNQLREFGAETHVLLLGDFNAEPFDRVFDVLPSARFRDVVQRHKPRSWDDLLLYNTSWRWLGELHAWSGVDAPSTAGTYRAFKRSPQAWRTVDQVLVSASLLRCSGWTLLEGETKVLLHELAFDSSAGRLRKPLDHLPVVGRIARLGKEKPNG